MENNNTSKPENFLIKDILAMGPEEIRDSINTIMATMALYTTQLLYKSMDTEEYVWTLPDKVEESIACLYGFKNRLDEFVMRKDTEKTGKSK